MKLELRGAYADGVRLVAVDDAGDVVELENVLVGSVDMENAVNARIEVRLCLIRPSFLIQHQKACEAQVRRRLATTDKDIQKQHELAAEAEASLGSEEE